MRSEQESDLGRLAQAITNVLGVVAVVLFGSRARGDYDEYSDYDLLVVFENDEVMWKNRRKLYENVGKLGLFTQVLTRSVRELQEKTEPTFLQNVLQHGVLLYLRYPYTAPAFAQNLKPVSIVSYSLKGLSQNEKMRVIYRLFGRERKGESLRGVVGEGGGRKLGDGCFMIPTERLDGVINVLKRHKVTFDVLGAYLPYLIQGKFIPL
ncbi:MAG: nucleotidyltransferase domain-containing protein [Candidatus Bathyarchaeota archaeon]|nr:nucleotidyltransferase domain-containing protein [Candidatus Bathyarchaeota archaeon]